MAIASAYVVWLEYATMLPIQKSRFPSKSRSVCVVGCVERTRNHDVAWEWRDKIINKTATRYQGKWETKQSNIDVLLILGYCYTAILLLSASCAKLGKRKRD